MMRAFARPKVRSERPVLLDRVSTLRYALGKGLSIARFGDGVLTIALGGSRMGRILRLPRRGISFQEWDATLSRMLRHLLMKPVPGVLVCFNTEFMLTDRHPVVLQFERATKDYSEFLNVRGERDVGVLSREQEMRAYRRWFARIVSSSEVEVWGESTCFSLCYYFEHYRDDRLDEVLELYAQFFRGRNILFVCPKVPLHGSSFHRLVDLGVIRSPAEVFFLDIPNRNCFTEHERILHEVLDNPHVDTVMLQAGPTATALVGALARHKLTAYDVGSFNVSLERAWRVLGVWF